MGVLSKLTISALVGMLGAMMIAGVTFLGDQLERQLASRDALGVFISEIVPPDQAGALASPEDAEAMEWEDSCGESVTFYQLPASARIDGTRDVPVAALLDPERHGYPDAVILLTNRQPEGTMAVAAIESMRVEALAMPPKGHLFENFTGTSEVLVAGVSRLRPFLQKGFTRQILLQARSPEAVEQAHRISDTLQFVEQRRISIRSTLPLLRQLREVRDLQRGVLLAVVVGSTLVLGLVCGALAWMEFREERYLLALIRSFGVGRMMLLIHAVLENCLVAVTGVIVGLFLLRFSASWLDFGVLDLDWLAGGGAAGGGWLWVLVIAALLGGLMSCVPVGIGLRKPLGLVLK